MASVGKYGVDAWRSWFSWAAVAAPSQTSLISCWQRAVRLLQRLA